MKKFGFTMAELMIALAIIGVVAAITMPTVSNMIPDKNKIAVLKYNKVISDISDDLLSDHSIYYKDGANPDCIGLNCGARPYTPPYNTADYEGTKKYVTLFGSKTKNFGTKIEENKKNTITMDDGSTWTVQYLDGLNSSSIVNMASISIDVNGPSKGKNCVYDSSNCKKPDTFEFYVNSLGKVAGKDKLTKVYLANPDRLNDKRNDYKAADS